MQSWYLSEGCGACSAKVCQKHSHAYGTSMQYLQYIGDAMAELLIHADLGSAVAINVKTSVVKRVLESYAACSMQLAELVKRREDRNQHGDDAADVAALQRGAQQLHARGVAAHAAAASQNVLAAKWLPP